MSKRTPSSRRWLAEHEADVYVREARQLGYRSRATFKLKEINERDRLLKPGMTVVDLGAAPGGWSQYASSIVGSKGRIFALDILPMDPIPGVFCVCGDFYRQEVLDQFSEIVPAGTVDLVLSDMAPNISGIRVADQAASMGLAELALVFAEQNLRRGGGLLVKVFQGEGFDAYLKHLKAIFGGVQIRKPRASRNRSSEIYLLARNFRLV